MILKPQENHAADINELKTLLRDPSADVRAKRRIEDQIRQLIAGDQGEADAAYQIDFHYRNTPNWVVIHDLRLEHDGRVAQIDHLLINRLMEFWVCESKRFSNGVTINDQGEFTVWKNRIPNGVASPIEQNKRHLKVLQHLIDDGHLKLPTRLGLLIKPKLRSLILVSKGAIKRPKIKLSGIESVIKTDQINATLTWEYANGNALDLAKLIGPSTLEDIGRQLVALHKPITYDWRRRFGLDAVDPAQPEPAKSVEGPSICSACSKTLSRGVVEYCHSNARFGGRLFCMACQKGVAEAGAERP